MPVWLSPVVPGEPLRALAHPRCRKLAGKLAATTDLAGTGSRQHNALRAWTRCELREARREGRAAPAALEAAAREEESCHLAMMGSGRYRGCRGKCGRDGRGAVPACCRKSGLVRTGHRHHG